MRKLRQDYVSIPLSSGLLNLLRWVLVLSVIWICPLAIRNCRRRPARSRNVTACEATPLRPADLTPILVFLHGRPCRTERIFCRAAGSAFGMPGGFRRLNAEVGRAILPVRLAGFSVVVQWQGHARR